MVHSSPINRQTLVAKEWSRGCHSRPFYHNGCRQLRKRGNNGQSTDITFPSHVCACLYAHVRTFVCARVSAIFSVARCHGRAVKAAVYSAMSTSPAQDLSVARLRRRSQITPTSAREITQVIECNSHTGRLRLPGPLSGGERRLIGASANEVVR